MEYHLEDGEAKGVPQRDAAAEAQQVCDVSAWTAMVYDHKYKWGLMSWRLFWEVDG
jgi:hypothetical protein